MENSIFIPHNTKELYDKMLAEQFVGEISVEKDMIIWKLPNSIILTIFVLNIPPDEGYIGTSYPYGKKELILAHWHPATDEIYNDLLAINTGQTLWIVKKRKIDFRNSPRIIERKEWETFSERKKSRYEIL